MWFLFTFFLPVFTNVGGLTFRTLRRAENLNSYLYYATPRMDCAVGAIGKA